MGSFTLNNHDIHLWHIAIDEAACRGEANHCLPSDEEQQQAARFTNIEAHNVYVRTRWAMRSILGSYLDAPAKSVALTLADLGKPMLAKGQHELDLRFNLTHSGDLALLAVRLGQEVGVDLEMITSKHRPLALAKRYFSDSTVSRLADLSDSEQQLALLHLWTQYEAYKKAQGLGLRGGDPKLPLWPLAEVDTFQTFPANGPEQLNSWMGSQLDPQEGYVGGLVTAQKEDEIHSLSISHIDYSIIE